MRIELSPTDLLEVALEDTDGTITIDARHYALKISTNTEDDTGRMGTLYSETFKKEFNDEVVRTAECVDCHMSFAITVGMVEFMKNLYGDKYHDPVRCKSCRVARRSYVRET